MNAIKPMNPVQRRISDETAKTLSQPMRFAKSGDCATFLVCRTRGGVGASTVASTIFCLADAEINGTFIEVAGTPGYAYRAHKGAKVHIANSDDVITEILDLRIARPNELMIVELEAALLPKVEKFCFLLGTASVGPVHIIYVADENEDYPPFAKHLAKIGLPIPMVVTKPTASMQKSDLFVTMPRLSGDIKTGFYRDRLTLSQAIKMSSQHGSQLMLSFELREFRQQLEEHFHG